MIKQIPIEISETNVNIISPGCKIEGEIFLDQVTRVHGQLKGKVRAPEGSTLVLGETGVIEGNVQADRVVIDGYVKGDIHAFTNIVISSSGRVIGNLNAPSIQIECGAFFEGSSKMADHSPNLN